MNSHKLEKLLLNAMFVIAIGLVAWAILPTLVMAKPAKGNLSFNSVSSARGSPTPVTSGLTSEVEDFIAGNYLGHTEEFPDTNESVSILGDYLKGNELLSEHRVEEALHLFSDAVTREPKMRHAHAGLANALYAQYHDSRKKSDLRKAIHEYITAAEIGFSFQKVRYSHLIAEGLAHLKDKKGLDSFFQAALQVGDRKYLLLIDYGKSMLCMRK